MKYFLYLALLSLGACLGYIVSVFTLLARRDADELERRTNNSGSSELPL